MRWLSRIVALACLLAVSLVGLTTASRGSPAPGADQPKILYLTFDDGPTLEFTAPLLDALAPYDAHVTFFQMGREAAAHPYLVRRIVREGHAIGNHSWSHPDLTTLDEATMTTELATTEAAQQGLAGPCLRPPYGEVNALVRTVAARLGLQIVLWNRDVGDWVERPVADLVESLKAATSPGVIIVMHDGAGPRQNNVTAVERMLPWWTKRGYVLKALPACLTGG